MMKNRPRSSPKLDLYTRIIFKTILQYQVKKDNSFSKYNCEIFVKCFFQDPNTGLVSDNENGHAWIRDNVYSIMGVWSLSLAYKKNEGKF